MRLEKKYCSLHNHSDYSNLRLIDSINKIDDLMEYAYNNNFSGWALTDHDSLSGHVKLIDKYKTFIQKEYNKKHPEIENLPTIQEIEKDLNFKVILGNEIYLAREGLTSATFEAGEKFYHIILLAKNAEGHKQLRQLSSVAWQRSFMRNLQRVYNYPNDLFDIIKGGNLVGTTACLGGFSGAMYLASVSNPSQAFYYENKIDNFLNTMTEILGIDNFYIELQPSTSLEQIAYNKFMLERYWDKYPFIIATDSHYIRQQDRELHKAALNSKDSKEREVDAFYSHAFMMTEEEIYSFLTYVSDDKIREMLENTKKIAGMCEFYELAQEQIITKVPYEEINDEREIFNLATLNNLPTLKYFLTTTNDTDAYFGKLITLGFTHKYNVHWDLDKYFLRLEEELKTIKEVSEIIKKPLADYFISMHKMINLIWDEGDSFVCPSRGSAGALLIDYLLGITQMNPIEQEIELPVWRFLHPSRPELPDIDIDTESSKRVKVFNRVQDYFRSIGGDLINICTFGTEGTKSALQDAARGLKIDNDVVVYLTSMIPNERGFDWTLDQCYHGDADHTAIKAFKEEINLYPGFWQLARKMEGLITHLGVHASGVLAINGDLVDHNSMMKTNKGQLVSAFDLHDSETLGLVKYDFLTTSALDRIRQTFNYLLENKEIEWQGNLRTTYDKYLHPDVLDYTTSEMWQMVTEGKISSLFQFDTLTGSQAIQQIQPRNLTELAVANSVMRLKGDGTELPLDTYARYKKNIELWYRELADFNLNAEEITTLEKYLKPLSGIADSQESVMMLVMDKHIAGFSMKDANRLRKTIAKKEFREIEEVRKLYYESGEKCGTRKELLDYIWGVQIRRQLGYSFSSIHTTGYSLLALQEMNLAYHYPIIYWNAACLSVDSSAINDEDFYTLLDEGIIDLPDDKDVRSDNTMDYAKLATAIDKFKRITNIELPDINKSRQGFTPDVETNSILYGLKGICKITSPVISEIITNRPFTSVEDFVNKVVKKIVSKDKVINLIKSGAFNSIEKKSIEEILKAFIYTTADQKKKLTLQNANMLIDYNLLPEELAEAKMVYKITKEMRANRDSDKLYYIYSNMMVNVENIAPWSSYIREHTIIKEVVIENEILKVVDSNSWDAKIYEVQMNKIRKYIADNHDKLLTELNLLLFMEEYNKYASGDKLQWELESMNFYQTGHPLAPVINKLPVEITPLDLITENAQEGWFLIKGNRIPKMKIYSIAGTVIDKNKPKGLVTIQTPEGVINIKIYKDLFAIYNHTISQYNEYGEKTILEDSFFEKGTHLLISGILRGTTFIPKVYKNTGIKNIVKIELNNSGEFVGILEKGE